MRVTGSLAFVAASRAAFVVAKDPDDDARRLFLPLKNNIGNDEGGLAFCIQSQHIQSDAGLIETSRVIWDGAAVSTRAEEALAPQNNAEEKSELDDAKEFLRGTLGGGPVQSKFILAEGRQAGYAERTLRRAQKALGIEAKKEGMTRGWVWVLPSKIANNAEGRHTNSVAAFENLGHLRAEIHAAQDFEEF